MSDLASLRHATDAAVLLPGDVAFDEARPAYALAGEPAVIIRPATPAQVADALEPHGLVHYLG